MMALCCEVTDGFQIEAAVFIALVTCGKVLLIQQTERYGSNGVILLERNAGRTDHRTQGRTILGFNFAQLCTLADAVVLKADGDIANDFVFGQSKLRLGFGAACLGNSHNTGRGLIPCGCSDNCRTFSNGSHHTIRRYGSNACVGGGPGDSSIGCIGRRNQSNESIGFANLNRKLGTAQSNLFNRLFLLVGLFLDNITHVIEGGFVIQESSVGDHSIECLLGGHLVVTAARNMGEAGLHKEACQTIQQSLAVLGKLLGLSGIDTQLSQGNDDLCHSFNGGIVGTVTHLACVIHLICQESQCLIHGSTDFFLGFVIGRQGLDHHCGGVQIGGTAGNTPTAVCQLTIQQTVDQLVFIGSVIGGRIDRQQCKSGACVALRAGPYGIFQSTQQIVVLECSRIIAQSSQRQSNSGIFRRLVLIQAAVGVDFLFNIGFHCIQIGRLLGTSGLFIQCACQTEDQPLTGDGTSGNLGLQQSFCSSLIDSIQIVIRCGGLHLRQSFLGSNQLGIITDQCLLFFGQCIISLTGSGDLILLIQSDLTNCIDQTHNLKHIRIFSFSGVIISVMEDNNVAILQALLRNTQRGMHAIQRIHPAAQRTVGKLTDTDAVLGDILHIVAAGIDNRQVIGRCNHLQNLKDSCTGLYLIISCRHPGLQIAVDQGMDCSFALLMLVVAQQGEVHGDRIGKQFHHQAVGRYFTAAEHFCIINAVLCCQTKLCLCFITRCKAGTNGQRISRITGNIPEALAIFVHPRVIAQAGAARSFADLDLRTLCRTDLVHRNLSALILYRTCVGAKHRQFTRCTICGHRDQGGSFFLLHAFHSDGQVFSDICNGVNTIFSGQLGLTGLDHHVGTIIAVSHSHGKGIVLTLVDGGLAGHGVALAGGQSYGVFRFFLPFQHNVGQVIQSILTLGIAAIRFQCVSDLLRTHQVGSLAAGQPIEAAARLKAVQIGDQVLCSDGKTIGRIGGIHAQCSQGRQDLRRAAGVFTALCDIAGSIGHFALQIIQCIGNCGLNLGICTGIIGRQYLQKHTGNIHISGIAIAHAEAAICCLEPEELIDQRLAAPESIFRNSIVPAVQCDQGPGDLIGCLFIQAFKIIQGLDQIISINICGIHTKQRQRQYQTRQIRRCHASLVVFQFSNNAGTIVVGCRTAGSTGTEVGENGPLSSVDLLGLFTQIFQAVGDISLCHRQVVDGLGLAGTIGSHGKDHRLTVGSVVQRRAGNGHGTIGQRDQLAGDVSVIGISRYTFTDTHNTVLAVSPGKAGLCRITGCYSDVRINAVAHIHGIRSLGSGTFQRGLICKGNADYLRNLGIGSACHLELCGAGLLGNDACTVQFLEFRDLRGQILPDQILVGRIAGCVYNMIFGVLIFIAHGNADIGITHAVPLINDKGFWDDDIDIRYRNSTADCIEGYSHIGIVHHGNRHLRSTLSNQAHLIHDDTGNAAVTAFNVHRLCRHIDPFAVLQALCRNGGAGNHTDDFIGCFLIDFAVIDRDFDLRNAGSNRVDREGLRITAARNRCSHVLGAMGLVLTGTVDPITVFHIAMAVLNVFGALPANRILHISHNERAFIQGRQGEGIIHHLLNSSVSILEIHIRLLGSRNAHSDSVRY